MVQMYSGTIPVDHEWGMVKSVLDFLKPTPYILLRNLLRTYKQLLHLHEETALHRQDQQCQQQDQQGGLGNPPPLFQRTNGVLWPR